MLILDNRLIYWVRLLRCVKAHEGDTETVCEQTFPSLERPGASRSFSRRSGKNPGDTFLVEAMLRKKPALAVNDRPRICFGEMHRGRDGKEY